MSLDNRLMLVKSVMLLYRESTLVTEDTNSADLVRTVLEKVKIPELSLGVSGERELLSALKDTVLYMCDQGKEHVYDKADLLQRLKLNCGDENKLYDILHDGIDRDMDENGSKRSVLNIRKFLNDCFRDSETIDLFKQAYGTLMFDRSKIKNLRSFVNEFVTKIEPYAIETTRRDPGIVDSIDLGDIGGLTEVCKAVAEQASGQTILKLGWQDMNDTTQGGFRLGECITLQALQHNFKTGFSLTVYKQIAIYNDPPVRKGKEGKKPLLLRISTEDSLLNNVQFLFQNLKENENGGVTPDLGKTDYNEVARFVQEKMQVKGFHVKMIRANPSEWTYRNIQNLVLEFEAAGYDVIMLMMDYLPMIPTTGCEQGPAGTDLRDLLRRMRNFCSARGTIFFTPWQISTDGKMLKREGATDFAKKIAGGGYFAGSKQIDQEPDLELVIDIVQHNGRAFLAVQRGKHRGTNVIPEARKSFVLPFPPTGSIPDDLGKARIGLRRVGGGAIGSGEEIPFNEFDDLVV